MKNKTASDYANEFTAKHPEVGEVRSGSTISPRGFGEFAHLINDALVGIDRSPSPSRVERVFVRTAADMLTRTLYVLVGDRRVEQDSALERACTEIIRAAERSAQALPDDALLERLRSEEASISNKLDAALGVVQETPVVANEQADEFITHRGNLVSIAQAAAQGIGALAAEGEAGLPVDAYLEGNLQDLVAVYEKLEEVQ